MGAKKAVIVMGPPGTGKTTFVNRAADASLDVVTGLESGPIEVKSATAHVEGVDIDVVDTPALDSKDAENAIIEYLKRNTNSTGIVGVVFMYEMTDVGRVDQTISQSCARFMTLCGLQNMPNAAVVTWSGSPVPDAERKITELHNVEPFDQIFRNGALMHYLDDSPQSAIDVLRLFVHQRPVVLACQYEPLRLAGPATQYAAEPSSPDTNCCCGWWPWSRK